MRTRVWLTTGGAMSRGMSFRYDIGGCCYHVGLFYICFHMYVLLIENKP